jgi:2-polyprenyl-3-methyl-5-hydroxy-6-metoxy-1,4-benzoquinol methylase
MNIPSLQFTAGMTTDSLPAAQDPRTFSFGRNWRLFVQQHLTPEREMKAMESIAEFLRLDSLDGLSFMDVGCGSGLFSLGAYRLGAKSIVSFDLDPFSVETCAHLRQRVGAPSDWVVLHGSVLDEAFVSRLEPADIVYAWGSLHHTGRMSEAIRNAAGRVKPGGVLYLSIYNRVYGRCSSEFWVSVKQRYNRASRTGKRLMEAAYVLRYGIVPDVLRFKNPVRTLRQYGQGNGRGMDYLTDVRDWLGGYPYEYATVEEIFRFCNGELKLQLENLRSTHTLGTNEYLFRQPAD